MHCGSDAVSDFGRMSLRVFIESSARMVSWSYCSFSHPNLSLDAPIYNFVGDIYHVILCITNEGPSLF